MDSHSQSSRNGDDDPFAFRAALRQQLVAQANKKFARKRLVHRSLIAAVWVMLIGTVGTVGLVATGSRDASASTIRVTESANYKVVSLVEIGADPQQVAKDLRSEGVDAEVNTVPVGPTAIGSFVGSGANEAADLKYVTNADGSSTSFRIRESYKSKLSIDIGRAAQPGENWSAGVDSFLDGYLFHCSKLWHATPDAIRAYASQKGFEVDFTSPTNPDVATGTNVTGVLTEANQYASNKVSVLLTEDGINPYAGLRQSTGATDCQ